MKKLTTIVLAAITALALAAPAAAQEGDPVCPPLDSGKIDVAAETGTLTLTAPAGYLIDGYCVKAGSVNQSDGPVFVEVDPPSPSVTISHPSGKNISHYSLKYSTTPTTTSSTTTSTSTTVTSIPTTTTTAPTTTTTPEVTTTAPGETTTTAPVTSTTDPKETTTTTAPPDRCEPDDPDCLPVTGFEAGLLTLGALGALGLGALLLRATRRSRRLLS